MGDPLPWREERHLQIELARNASQTGSGGVISTPVKQETSDYWSKFDTATREAIAVNKVLHAFKDRVKDCRVDVMIDNRAVMHAWNNQRGKGRDLSKGSVLYHKIRRAPLFADWHPWTIHSHWRFGMKHN